MTSGKMNKIKNHSIKALVLLTFLTVLVTVWAPVHALDANKPELAELLHQFEQEKQSTVDFKEEKHAFYLDEPITSSGYLQFFAPDKLYKFIVKPEKTSQKLTGNELEIVQAAQTQIINLNDYPEFSIILRSIISLLSGDLAALKSFFKITFESTSSGWTLLLTPHDSHTSNYVASIKMSGNLNKLEKIIVAEPNNDSSITHLYNHR
jgi:hypothetical protein